jgi:hypothetical protein
MSRPEAKLKTSFHLDLGRPISHLPSSHLGVILSFFPCVHANYFLTNLSLKVTPITDVKDLIPHVPIPFLPSFLNTDVPPLYIKVVLVEAYFWTLSIVWCPINHGFVFCVLCMCICSGLF